MISLRRPSSPPPAAAPRWPVAVAVAMTAGAFLTLLAAMARMSFAPAAAEPAPVPRGETVVYVARPVAAPATPARTPPAPSSAPVSRAVSGTVAAPALPRDTGGAPAASPAPAVTVSAPSAASTPPGGAGRLVPPPVRRGGGAWGPTVVFDPFAPRAAPSAEVRDSMLLDERLSLAARARTRVYTASERDALVKEGMLRNRVSGRVLLDPVVGDGTYSGRGSGGIGVPLFSPGPSRAERVRDSVSFAENAARLERLRRRADSLRAARP